MKRKQKRRFERCLEAYFEKTHQTYIEGGFREESFYSALEALLEECSELFLIGGRATATAQPEKTRGDFLDFVVRRPSEVIGHIEVKRPEADLEVAEASEQLERYRKSFPNLILTNLSEFRLYRDGDFIDKVDIGRRFMLPTLEHPRVPERLDLFFGLLNKFFSFSTPRVRTSEDLSKELAKRARSLEHLLEKELASGNDGVTGFYKTFKEKLIKSLNKEQFADLYAQTIAYGLFAARMRAGDEFSREVAWKFIPKSIPLLKAIFYPLIGPDFPESLSGIVDDMSQILEKADISAIREEFKKAKWDEDPVIHFYETFLATYNPKERQHKGVYYTPLPVVSYIVRSIHRLLKEKFGKAEGLATEKVTLLDPAAGTLTFVVQAIKQVQKELEDRGQGGLMPSYIEKHIIPDFHAFELLMAPYTVGHIKVARVLEGMGYQFKEDQRFQFYLTNTLEEMKEPTELKQRSFIRELAKEGRKAQKVKEEVPILVVLGNPPYSRSSENKSEFIERLMDDYKEGVGERNLQPLSDDYIKFIRWAHWKLDQAGKGILGFITNNSYLSGLVHRGMRRELSEAFDEVYILNLHGSSRIGERTPEGGKDENVFDIQQGVAIALYVKLEAPLEEKKVRYADLWGEREKKYKYLSENHVGTTRWQEIEPVAPDYFFVPKDFTFKEEYDEFWDVTEIFKDWRIGVQTHRDRFVIGFTKEELIRRLQIFTGDEPDEVVRKRLKLKDTIDFKLKGVRAKVEQEDLEDKICSYAYRAFDNRKICYSSSLIDRDRWHLMKSLLRENISLALSRRPVALNGGFTQVLAVDSIADSGVCASGTYFFPLYTYETGPKTRCPEKVERHLNFNKKFLNAVEESLGVKPSPGKILYYIYAVLYAPTYRKRYQEFLNIDFPKVPLPTEYGAFLELSRLGKELIALHLLKHPALEATEISFPESGSNTVEKVRYDEKTQRVYFNQDQYFGDIAREVWEYRIGRYRVARRYLKARKGRRLSSDEIEHCMRVAKAIRLTIELREKVDDVYCHLFKEVLR